MPQLLAIALICALAGCVRAPVTRAGVDAKGSPTITQTGEAKTPASAKVSTSKTTLQVPAGSVVTVPGALQPGLSRDASVVGNVGRVTPADPPAWSVTLSKPSALVVETRSEAVEGAETPTPPLPPSPVEIARGKGVRWFYFAGVASGVAALVCFWRKYPLAGLKCVAAAIAFPLVGNLVSEKWAVAVGGCLLIAAGSVVLAWKIIQKRHGLQTPA